MRSYVVKDGLMIKYCVRCLERGKKTEIACKYPGRPDGHFNRIQYCPKHAAESVNKSKSEYDYRTRRDCRKTNRELTKALRESNEALKVSRDTIEFLRAQYAACRQELVMTQSGAGISQRKNVGGGFFSGLRRRKNE